jgi:arginyl-tRNA synthetase
MILYGYKNLLDPAAYQADAVTELARLYRLVNQLCDYHETKEALPKLEQQHAERTAALQQAEAEADPKDKKAKQELGRLRKDLDGIHEELTSSRAKVEAVESSPKLRELAAAHPDIVRLTREETARLHAGDEENRRLWSEFLPECLRALEAVYRRMGVEFDLTLGESYYDPMLPLVVQDLEAQGLATESQGATCVFLEGHPAPFIVRKADGAYTYATTDLATIRYRAEELQADAMLYVVDARQSDHFKALFETARRWGYDKDFRHLSFGTVLGKDKRPYKTRAGNTVGLESLLDESIIEARKVIDENSPDLDEAARAEAAEKVGIGGIKYADLNHNRESDYVFDWDKMLAIRGDTATYMQYAYARVNGIFIRGKEDRGAIRQSDTKFNITGPAERALAFALLRFAEAVEDTAADYRPNLLTAYLFETANRYSDFYEKCPVLKSEGNVRASRLLLCDLTGRVIQRGLALLGIETSERM